MTNNNTIKLTDKQQIIIKLMKEGWMLSRFIRCWILENDEQAELINGNSVRFLEVKGLIACENPKPEEINVYTLTELGKNYML